MKYSSQIQEEFDLFDVDLMDSIFSEVSCGIPYFRDLSPYIWDLIEFLQHGVLEIRQAFPNTRDD